MCFACASCIKTTKLFFPSVVFCKLSIKYSSVGFAFSESPVREFQSICKILFWSSSVIACFFKSAYFPPTEPPGNLNRCELYSGTFIVFATTVLVTDIYLNICVNIHGLLYNVLHYIFCLLFLEILALGYLKQRMLL